MVPMWCNMVHWTWMCSSCSRTLAQTQLTMATSLWKAIHCHHSQELLTSAMLILFTSGRRFVYREKAIIVFRRSLYFVHVFSPTFAFVLMNKPTDWLLHLLWSIGNWLRAHLGKTMPGRNCLKWCPTDLMLTTVLSWLEAFSLAQRMVLEFWTLFVQLVNLWLMTGAASSPR